MSTDKILFLLRKGFIFGFSCVEHEQLCSREFHRQFYHLATKSPNVLLFCLLYNLQNPVLPLLLPLRSIQNDLKKPVRSENFLRAKLLHVLIQPRITNTQCPIHWSCVFPFSPRSARTFISGEHLINSLFIIRCHFSDKYIILWWGTQQIVHHV